MIRIQNPFISKILKFCFWIQNSQLQSFINYRKNFSIHLLDNLQYY